MDLTKRIVILTDSVLSLSNGVVCFNFDNNNEIYNMGTKLAHINIWEDDKDAVGIWKIKQLKQ